MTPQPEPHRICPGCGGKFPPLRYPNNRNQRTARPVWTCTLCYRRERRNAGHRSTKPSSGSLKDHQKRTPGAITGPGPKETTPETREKLRQLFRRDPEKVIHRLCDLMEGKPCLEEIAKLSQPRSEGASRAV